MRNTRKTILFALLCAMLLCPVLNAGKGQSVRAADYDYQVTISGGLHGTTATESVTMASGTMWNPNDYPVTVTDSKYYFKGYHISGREGLVGTTTITQDTVFVATYGIRGETVAYTVNYRDTQGNELAPSATFYGNVGDKPVVAFVYVEGYQPQAYNLTATLTQDGANEFTFVYTPVTTAAPAAPGTGEGTGTGTGAGAGAGAGTGTDNPAADNPQGTDVDNPQGTDVDNPQGADVDNPQGADEEEPNEPQELIDLDDEEVPLAAPDADGDSDTAYDAVEKSKGNLRTAVIIGAVSAAALAVIVAVLLRRRKKNEAPKAAEPEKADEQPKEE